MLLLAALGATLHCQQNYKKPWTAPKERTRFMVTVATKMLSPAPNACIEKVLEKIERRRHRRGGSNKQAPSKAPTRGSGHTRVMGSLGVCQAGKADVGTTDQPPTKLSAPSVSESDPCQQVVRQCGNCHLPRVNNCNYRITWQQQGEEFRFSSRVQRVGEEHLFFRIDNFEEITLRSGARLRGHVLADSPSSLLLHSDRQVRRIPKGSISSQEILPRQSAPTATSFRLPIAKIKRIQWVNGDDPLETWWNFKRFGPRGAKTLRMFDLVARYKVGCTNCHLGHGDFRLTAEGKHFKRTKIVIRRVPLEQFLKE